MEILSLKVENCMKNLNIHRNNQAFIQASIERDPVTILLGPRRVGKSYFMEQYRAAYPERHWVVLNMDLMAEKQEVEQPGGLESLITEKAEKLISDDREKIWVVIDEAQKCPALFEQIKVIYDQYKSKKIIKFILTGSALLHLHQLSAESLAGRSEMITMHGFALGEMVQLEKPKFPNSSLLDELEQCTKDYLTAGSLSLNAERLEKIVQQKRPFKKVLLEKLEHSLVYGSFPEVLEISSLELDQKIIYLKNYLQTYLEKDVRAIENITNLTLYRDLLDILAEQTGSLRDDSKVVSALGCARETIHKYRSVVGATLLYQDVYPYLGKALKRLVKSPKGYVLDNGLISVLTGLSDLLILEKTGLIGHRFENWFLNELNIWGARSALGQEVYFWQTTTQAEVDFVVERKPYIYPFEVTYQSDINRAKVRNLMGFLSEEPKASWGFYIYRGEFAVDHEKKIIFIPCWAIG